MGIMVCSLQWVVQDFVHQPFQRVWEVGPKIVSHSVGKSASLRLLGFRGCRG